MKYNIDESIISQEEIATLLHIVKNKGNCEGRDCEWCTLLTACIRCSSPDKNKTESTLYRLAIDDLKQYLSHDDLMEILL